MWRMACPGTLCGTWQESCQGSSRKSKRIPALRLSWARPRMRDTAAIIRELRYPDPYGVFSPEQQTSVMPKSAVRYSRPLAHKRWFEETPPSRLPDAFAFAHLDGDFSIQLWSVSLRSI